MNVPLLCWLFFWLGVAGGMIVMIAASGTLTQPYQKIGWKFYYLYLGSKRSESKCACYYDSDGGPYGVPHWEICSTCRAEGR